MSENQQQIQIFENLRDTFLSKLMTGKLGFDNG